MHVVRSTNVDDFLRRAGRFLEAREAEHNLIFGICSTIQADPNAYGGPPYLAAVMHGDKVVGAALRTPPWRLVLSVMDHPGAIHRLVDDLKGEEIPGVVGPAEWSRAFAEAWGRETGANPRLANHERTHRLQKVRLPRAAPGEARRATESDRAVVRDWIEAFMQEALPGDPPQDYDRMADRWIRGLGRTPYLWVDDMRPVSLACVGGLTPRGIRVGPVYTPPEARGRGYASNLVAAVSQMQLDAGRSFVFLFTDLANPTSNRIYKAIGYEPVNDVDDWEFA
jgi:predicted GNAT family acetyltransferase